MELRGSTRGAPDFAILTGRIEQTSKNFNNKIENLRMFHQFDMLAAETMKLMSLFLILLFITVDVSWPYNYLILQ